MHYRKNEFRILMPALAGLSGLCLFMLALQPRAFAQWKRATGFSNSLANNNIDQVSGFASWQNNVVADAKTPNDGSQGATTDSLFLSTDNGMSWSSFAPNGRLPLLTVNTGGPIPALLCVINFSGQFPPNDVVGYSTDGGQTWLQDTAAWPSPNGSSMTPMCFLAVGSTVYAGTAMGVYQQTSPGAAWTPDTVGTTVSGIPLPVTELAQSGTTLIAALGFNQGLVVSTNQGASWSRANAGLPLLNAQNWLPTWGFALSGSSVFAMVAHDNSDSTMDFFRSTNNGQSWTQMNSTPLDLTNVTPAIAASGNDLFVSGDNGFFVSTDNGASWTEANQGLDMAENTNPAVLVSGPNVILSSEDGAWYRPLSDFGNSSVTPQGTVANTGLDIWVSENPAFRSSEIRYRLDHNAMSDLAVYDVRGSKVTTLASGFETAGMHVIPFDGSRLSAGIYYCRLSCDGQSIGACLQLIK